MTKASNNEFPSVLFGELASAPTTPATGKWRLYTKAGGLYYVDDAGVEIGPLAAASSAPAFLGARYETNAGQTITASAAIVDFEDAVYDTGSDVTIGAAWKFTAPETGYYHVDCLVMMQNNTGWGAGERGFMQLYKNNAAIVTLDRRDYNSNPDGGSLCLLHGSTTILLSAGDYVDVRVSQSSGANIALDTSAISNWINIEKVG